LHLVRREKKEVKVDHKKPNRQSVDGQLTSDLFRSKKSKKPGNTAPPQKRKPRLRKRRKEFSPEDGESTHSWTKVVRKKKPSHRPQTYMLQNIPGAGSLIDVYDY